MTRHFCICFILAVAIASPREASADETTIYEAIDAFQVSETSIRITGIIAGASAPTAKLYFLGRGNELAPRCDRFAMLAMSKPGKFQLAIVTPDGTSVSACQLIVRTP
jgi:hypothetical protein